MKPQCDRCETRTARAKPVPGIRTWDKGAKEPRDFLLCCSFKERRKSPAALARAKVTAALGEFFPGLGPEALLAAAAERLRAHDSAALDDAVEASLRE